MKIRMQTCFSHQTMGRLGAHSFKTLISQRSLRYPNRILRSMNKCANCLTRRCLTLISIKILNHRDLQRYWSWRLSRYHHYLRRRRTYVSANLWLLIAQTKRAHTWHPTEAPRARRAKRVVKSWNHIRVERSLKEKTLITIIQNSIVIMLSSILKPRIVIASRIRISFPCLWRNTRWLKKAHICSRSKLQNSWRMLETFWKDLR